jgi:hypothetical protein
MTETPVTETPAETNGAAAAPPATIEDAVKLCAWLIAELQYRNLRLATTLAALLTQQAQPAMQQSMLNQLMG